MPTTLSAPFDGVMNGALAWLIVGMLVFGMLVPSRPISNDNCPIETASALYKT
jgi:hypothetical protein